MTILLLSFRYVLVALLTATVAIAAEQAADTGEISGVILTTNVPATPMARVLVTISGAGLRSSRTSVSDEQGHFVFRNLPAGTFTISAVRPSYARTAFGARRPGRAGTPVSLAAGQHLNGMTLALPRGAIITGLVRNTVGEPMSGVKVSVTPLQPQASSVGPWSFTDDRGVYRIFGLAPGGYLVAAEVADTGSTSVTQMSEAEMDQILARLTQRTLGTAAPGPATPGRAPATPPPPGSAARATYGYAAIYFPGTANPDDALTVRLDAGEERTGVDMTVQLVRTVAVDGRVTGPTGPAPAGVRLTLTPLRVPGGTGNYFASQGTMRQTDPNGNFRFTGVSPGRYRLLARLATSPGPTPEGPRALWALTNVVVTDQTVSGVALELQAGLRVTGRLQFDARAEKPPVDLSTVRMRLVSLDGSPSTGVSTGRPDGTFEINGMLPGAYVVSSTLEGSSWWLRSVVINGRDVLDMPLDLGPDGDLSAAVATFTDRHSELVGLLESAAGTPARDYFVVVVPADRSLWRPGARRIQFTRPATDGRFVIKDLPGGDYLIAALTDMEPEDVRDMSFVESLTAAAVPVRVAEGAQTIQNLRVSH